MTTEYTKLVGKEVEASVFDNDDWFKGTLMAVNIDRVVIFGLAGCTLGEPKTTFEVEADGHRLVVGNVRPVRKFKEGDKVIAMFGDEGTVEGYTDSGRICVKVNGITWVTNEDCVTKKPESFFGGFDFSVRTGVVTEGSLICVDTDSLFMQEYRDCPVGVAIDLVEETHTAPAFEIGMPVTCPPCDEDSVPIGTVTGFGDDETDVQVQIWGSRDVIEFDEAAIVPYIVTEEKIEVKASKDMEPGEKLEKVKEFAKELGVDVNEITGRSGCVGLVVRK